MIFSWIILSETIFSCTITEIADSFIARGITVGICGVGINFSVYLGALGLIISEG